MKYKIGIPALYKKQTKQTFKIFIYKYHKKKKNLRITKINWK